MTVIKRALTESEIDFVGTYFGGPIGSKRSSLVAYVTLVKNERQAGEVHRSSMKL